MENDLTIERIHTMEKNADELSELLMKTVEDGASVGFLSPIKRRDAADYWHTVLVPDIILLAAKIDHKIVGSVQLHLSTKANGRHRAEVAKLMIHPDYRRNGIGRLLMQEAEETAIREGRSLLVLDTREGDPSNLLYNMLGYRRAGRIKKVQ